MTQETDAHKMPNKNSIKEIESLEILSEVKFIYV